MNATRLPAIASFSHRRLTVGALAGLTTGLLSLSSSALGQATPAAAAPAVAPAVVATPAAPAAAAAPAPAADMPINNVLGQYNQNPYLPDGYTEPKPVVVTPRVPTTPLVVANVQYLGFSVEGDKTYYVVHDVRSGTSHWLTVGGQPWVVPSGGTVAVTGVDAGGATITLDQAGRSTPVNLYHAPANQSAPPAGGQQSPAVITSTSNTGGGNGRGRGGQQGAQVIAAPVQQQGGPQGGVLGGPGQQLQGQNGQQQGRRGGPNGQQPGAQGGQQGAGAFQGAGTGGRGQGGQQGAQQGAAGRGQGNAAFTGAGNGAAAGGNGFNNGGQTTGLTQGTTTNNANAAGATRRTIVQPTGNGG